MIKLDHVSKTFKDGKRVVEAVKDVSLEIAEAETTPTFTTVCSAMAEAEKTKAVMQADIFNNFFIMITRSFLTCPELGKSLKSIN